MKQIRFSAICLVAAISAGIHSSFGQGINPIVQNSSVRIAPSRVAPAAKPVVNQLHRHVAARPTSFTPRTLNTYASYDPTARSEFATELFAGRAEFES